MRGTEPVSQRRTPPVTVLDTEAVSQLGTPSVTEFGTHPFCRLRTEPFSRLGAEPVSTLGAEPFSRLRTEPFSTLGAEPFTRLDSEPSRPYRIDSLKAPLFVSWQVTRDCDLSCVHCCTGSAPGKRLPDELNADEALHVAADLIRSDVPYVMLCGGEPLIVPHFLELAQKLGSAGVQLKIETNGQQLDGALAERLAALTVRSVQISLDGDTQAVYARQRPGASLHHAHAACQRVTAAGLPLEVTFAPTRLNIHEVRAVIERARALGAFRFSTGRLMRMGTAARRWEKLSPSPDEYRAFRDTLQNAASAQEGSASGGAQIELCYTPFSVAEALHASLAEPPATLLVLPNGWVKVAAALPDICADLRRHTLAQAWSRYRAAWRDVSILAALRRALEDESSHAESNNWRMTASADH